MLRVREIMTPQVVTVSPDATLREAIETLVTCRIGGAPVLEGKRIVGVLSAPDILEFESVTPATVRGTKADEEEEETGFDAAAEWDAEDDAPAAFFTDLWSSDEIAIADFTPGNQWDFLADHSVSEAMSRSVCTVPASLEVSAAAERMLSAGVQRALVTEDDELVGILTTTDILRAVAERRLSVRQFVFD